MKFVESYIDVIRMVELHEWQYLAPTQTTN